VFTQRIASFKTPAAGSSSRLLCGAMTGLALMASTAWASSVAPMSLKTVSDHAGQVIMGTVVSVRSYWADAPRRIESEITLDDVEYIKGALSDSTTGFTLIVPGGVVGQTSMRLSCAPIFNIGERWMLFILPSYKTFPTVGLWHGAMRIVQSATGTSEVLDATGNPVVGIDGEGFVRVAQKSADNAVTADEILVGATKARLMPKPGRAESGQALLLDEFLAQLQPILDSSKDHHLTGPAGRRELVQHIAVPLRQSSKPLPGTLMKRANHVSPLARPVVQPMERSESGRTTEVGK